MQDALSRLHWTVQTERAAQLVERNTFMQVLLALGVLVIFGAFAVQAQTQDKPLYLAAGFALVLSLIGLAALWLRRLYRAVEEE
jgi:protein-S-isoprenylcysteine O-methyltransferase Ste14